MSWTRKVQYLDKYFPTDSLHNSKGLTKIYHYNSKKVFAMHFFLICYYLGLFLSFVSAIQLFARKYALQKDAGSKQFSSINSTRKADKKGKKNKNNKNYLNLCYCWHLKQQAVKMVSLKNKKPNAHQGIDGGKVNQKFLNHCSSRSTRINSKGKDSRWAPPFPTFVSSALLHCPEAKWFGGALHGGQVIWPSLSSHHCKCSPLYCRLLVWALTRLHWKTNQLLIRSKVTCLLAIYLCDFLSYCLTFPIQSLTQLMVKMLVIITVRQFFFCTSSNKTLFILFLYVKLCSLFFKNQDKAPLNRDQEELVQVNSVEFCLKFPSWPVKGYSCHRAVFLVLNAISELKNPLFEHCTACQFNESANWGT